MTSGGSKNTLAKKAGQRKKTRVSLSKNSRPQQTQTNKVRKPANHASPTTPSKAKIVDDKTLSPPVAVTKNSLPAYGPALGLLELNSVARGMVVADLMCKKAVIHLLEAHSITPGKYLVLVVGGEEEISQALQAGKEMAADTLVDSLFLPNPDSQILPAIKGEVPFFSPGSLGIIETFSVASAVLAADRAVKTAEVKLIQMRLAKGLGGRAFIVLNGELHQLEAAIEAGQSIIYDGMLLTTEIIAHPHEDLIKALNEQRGWK